MRRTRVRPGVQGVKDELVFDISDVLTKVNPTTNRTGLIYKLTRSEKNLADRLLLTFLNS